MASRSADRMFRAFADETRLRILHLLRSRPEMCVCEFMAVLGAGQSKVSRHLAYLKRAGLVSGRRVGLWRRYSLNRPRRSFHKELIRCLDECFREVGTFRRDLRQLELFHKKRCCRP